MKVADKKESEEELYLRILKYHIKQADRSIKNIENMIIFVSIFIFVTVSVIFGSLLISILQNYG